LATPTVGPDVGTVAVPKTTVLSVTVVWVRKLTCPPRVAGTTVAVRVVLVPDSTGLAGLAAKVTPETRIEPISAAGEPAVQLNTAPPTSKETDAIPTDTFVPGLPDTGTVVDSPVQLPVTVSFATKRAAVGAVTVPPGDRFTLTSVK
jgi:hypothetical protein